MAALLGSAAYASVDIGSHTVRLLIARLFENGVLAPVRLERRITRLARDFQTRGCLDEEGVRSTLETLNEYARIMASEGVHSAACGATGVVRRAAEGGRFLEKVMERTGLSGRILSESAEAFLSAKGVLSVLPRTAMGVLIFDLGGSTTEFLHVASSAQTPSWSRSVFLGAALVTERFLREAPAPDRAMREARQHIREVLREVMDLCLRQRSVASPSPGWELVGTAGTVTTLAAMHLGMAPYIPHRVNGHVLTEDWVASTIERLASMNLSQRQELTGLEAGREDIILGGALIVHEILLGLGRRRMLTADAGLLEGLLLDLVERERFGRAELHTPLRWLFPGEPEDLCQRSA